MDPVKVSRSDRRWTVRFRSADRFGTVQCPERAQQIARRHSQGAHVRLGQLGNGALVEVVTVSRFRHPCRSDAVDVAETIAEAVET